ncbi:hypothetical protein GCM10023193_17630 [Planotetraspora kaengkrachanensis]|uniref:Uncharacterized protein n=1 Tax=Planotetraspora kaengkrachanensis TaxID=575193 RepID=A0A8J3LZT4_9ACTN|nr:hypothetical protein Pka01_28870 [Planotetraspora kaengkrachanensis]
MGWGLVGAVTRESVHDHAAGGAVVVAVLTVPFLWVATPAELRQAAESDTGEHSDADHENIRRNGNRT